MSTDADLIRHQAHKRAGTVLDTCPLCAIENFNEVPRSMPEVRSMEVKGTESLWRPKRTVGTLSSPPVPPVAEAVETYDASEQDVILQTFAFMLAQVTKDGGNKRARGEKSPWYVDGAHEAAIFSHINKWKHGEVVDPDSGSHPLVHLAWRALAIAYQETYGKKAPRIEDFLV